MIVDLQAQVVQALWTDVQGLEEYFKDTNGGELRLQLSLDNLGQLIDLSGWGSADFVFTVDSLPEGAVVQSLGVIQGELFRMTSDSQDLIKVAIDVEQIALEPYPQQDPQLDLEEFNPSELEPIKTPRSAPKNENEDLSQVTVDRSSFYTTIKQSSPQSVVCNKQNSSEDLSKLDYELNELKALNNCLQEQLKLDQRHLADLF